MRSVNSVFFLYILLPLVYTTSRIFHNFLCSASPSQDNDVVSTPTVTNHASRPQQRGAGATENDGDSPETATTRQGEREGEEVALDAYLASDEEQQARSNNNSRQPTISRMVIKGNVW